MLFLLMKLDDVDLLEMYLISGNIGKHFVVSSRSPGRTSLITPSKSYVVDVVAFSNCRMLLQEFSSPLNGVDKVACDWPKDVILTLGVTLLVLIA
ncbi:hypothetical protein H5410_036035 [Solanum commersonii]|uniref:Uncharacterized protein n=1 Tax=Solanum commersonii TaxID=4109 RepID=A0A9J5Y2E8_SOLCO|nr:hypothetical protein H5410_036035 [Solanum commersonii]